MEIPESDIWQRPTLKSGVVRLPKYTAYMYIRGTKCIAFLLAQAINEALRVEEPVVCFPALLESDDASTSDKDTGTALSSLAALRARKEAAAELVKKKSLSPITLSTKSCPACLGICRIWTSPLYRKTSLATNLLDTAMKYHDAVARQKETEQCTRTELLRKEDMAFSQPTEAGRRLAEKWFGKTWGWGVYVD